MTPDSNGPDSPSRRVPHRPDVDHCRMPRFHCAVVISRSVEHTDYGDDPIRARRVGYAANGLLSRVEAVDAARMSYLDRSRRLRRTSQSARSPSQPSLGGACAAGQAGASRADFGRIDGEFANSGELK
jgi:hypothetical protein